MLAQPYLNVKSGRRSKKCLKQLMKKLLKNSNVKIKK